MKNKINEIYNLLKLLPDKSEIFKILINSSTLSSHECHSITSQINNQINIPKFKILHILNELDRGD